MSKNRLWFAHRRRLLVGALAACLARGRRGARWSKFESRTSSVASTSAAAGTGARPMSLAGSANRGRAIALVGAWVAAVIGGVSCATAGDSDRADDAVVGAPAASLVTTSSIGPSETSTAASPGSGPGRQVLVCDQDGTCERVSSPAVADGDARDAALAEQLDYLADQVLTREEYAEAFANFMRCANEGGGHVEISDVDPESGQITYVILEDGHETAMACYEMHFLAVDTWFQTTDPVALRQEVERNRSAWRQYVVPCLERFGVHVPEHLDGSEIYRENSEASPFYDIYNEYSLAGSCE